MKILLIEPDFPIPPKSKNHKNFLPIGLLKIASYLKENNNEVRLVRGKLNIDDFEFEPDEIWITSLFTYWSEYVRNSVRYYKRMFPRAKVVVGGIYASLMPKHCKKFTGCDEIFRGVYKEAESYFPLYELINDKNPHPIDYQIIHTSRGCIRHCDFCGTWKIEPQFEAKNSIKNEIEHRKLVFYDNNLLANPYIEDILYELIELKRQKEILWCESQSGFDGRKLQETPHLGRLIKKAGFRYPRVAWDWGYSEYPKIKKQINVLIKGGYNSKEIFVFVLYNWDITFEEMEKKRIKCWKWHVQIADCRFRPLDQTFDNYNPRKLEQTNDDYYIHEKAGWNDALVRQFRKNVRRQNICVRHGFPFYSNVLERMRLPKEKIIEIMKNVDQMKTKKEKKEYLDGENISFWFPDEITSLKNIERR
ncbi:MAG: cobalamin-dependent protein [Nitrospirota bacterium]